VREGILGKDEREGLETYGIQEGFWVSNCLLTTRTIDDTIVAIEKPNNATFILKLIYLRVIE
jgi:hypothetical protein